MLAVVIGGGSSGKEHGGQVQSMLVAVMVTVIGTYGVIVMNVTLPSSSVMAMVRSMAGKCGQH